MSKQRRPGAAPAKYIYYLIILSVYHKLENIIASNYILEVRYLKTSTRKKIIKKSLA